MAPATSEAASPIGIANVSLFANRCYKVAMADAPCEQLPNQRYTYLRRLQCGGKDSHKHRHKIVAKRGAAFTIMVFLAILGVRE